MINFRIYVFLIILIAQPVLGSESSGVYTVDMGKLFRSSEFGKLIIVANNQARQRLQNENEELEAKLLSEEKELSQQRKLLSLDEFRPKASEFDKKVSIIRTEQSTKEENLNNKARKEKAEFYRRIYPLLYELLLEKGGLVLVDQRNAILWDSSVDITDDAIKLINQVLGSSAK